MGHRTWKWVKKGVMCFFPKRVWPYWKRVWPYWPATPISYRAKTNKWILLLSGSNFLFLGVDKQNRKFFQENLSQSVQMFFFLNAIWRHLWIVGLRFLNYHLPVRLNFFTGRYLRCPTTYRNGSPLKIFLRVVPTSWDKIGRHYRRRNHPRLLIG